MDYKDIKESVDAMERESYFLLKSIQALMYKVIPVGVDNEDDYTLSLLSIIENQAKLVHKTSEDLTFSTNKMLKEIKGVDYEE